MSYRKLTEGTITLMIDYIKANIGAALDVVGANVGVPQMTIENPVQYFIAAKQQGYRVPAVFVLSDDMDFQIDKNKSNFINAMVFVNVSVVVEDQDEEILTYKVWRYQSALHSVLDEADIVSTDQKLSLKSVVYHAQGSDVYENTNAPTGGGIFRKEVVLKCQVEHREGF